MRSLAIFRGKVRDVIESILAGGEAVGKLEGQVLDDLLQGDFLSHVLENQAVDEAALVERRYKPAGAFTQSFPG